MPIKDIKIPLHLFNIVLFDLVNRNSMYCAIKLLNIEIESLIAELPGSLG